MVEAIPNHSANPRRSLERSMFSPLFNCDAQWNHLMGSSRMRQSTELTPHHGGRAQSARAVSGAGIGPDSTAAGTETNISGVDLDFRVNYGRAIGDDLVQGAAEAADALPVA